MYRLLVGGCVLAVAVIAARADDEKKDEKLVEVFKKMMTEARKEYFGAKKEEEKEKILKNYGEKFLDLAQKNPKDPFTVQILISVATMPLKPGKDSPRAKALAMIKKDHADSPAIANLVRQLGMAGGEDAIEFLQGIADQNKNKAVRVEAVKALMGAHESVLLNSDDQKKVAAARQAIEAMRKRINTEFKGEIKDLFVGAKMPELTSKDLDDKEVKLSDYKGKVVVLDIWATWCPPCRAMIPHSRELVKRLKDKPFALVSISFDDKKETVTNFLKDNPMPWTHWFNGRTGAIGKELAVQFFPTIYVVDATGVIRFKNVREKQLDKAVDKLLKEMDEAKKGKTE